MRDDTDDLTPTEREAFARLERTAPLDPMEEERTVRRVAGPGGGGGARRARGGRRGRWPRPVRVGLAIPAGLACFFTGLWSGRAGFPGARAESRAAGAGQPSAAQAAPQQSAQAAAQG